MLKLANGKLTKVEAPEVLRPCERCGEALRPFMYKSEARLAMHYRAGKCFVVYATTQFPSLRIPSREASERGVTNVTSTHHAKHGDLWYTLRKSVLAVGAGVPIAMHYDALTRLVHEPELLTACETALTVGGVGAVRRLFEDDDARRSRERREAVARRESEIRSRAKYLAREREKIDAELAMLGKQIAYYDRKKASPCSP